MQMNDSQRIPASKEKVWAAPNASFGEVVGNAAVAGT